jgi:predicted nucleic acid-binding protein
VNIFLDANICLDLLDTKRPTSEASVAWYMGKKDDTSLNVFFSSDFITTFYYILTQKRKYDDCKVIAAIDALSFEIEPFYLTHNDFINAKSHFFDGSFHDFEDLMVLNSALRAKCEMFMTNDKELLKLDSFLGMKILGLR